MKYRIVKEVGKLTNKTRFYVQKRKKKLFRKEYRWINVHMQHIMETNCKIQLEFNTKEEAQNWINNKIETYNVEYFDIK